MLSNLLIKLLLVEYLVIAVVCIFEGNWPRVTYWISASGLQIAILWGMR